MVENSSSLPTCRNQCPPILICSRGGKLPLGAIIQPSQFPTFLSLAPQHNTYGKKQRSALLFWHQTIHNIQSNSSFPTPQNYTTRLGGLSNQLPFILFGKPIPTMSLEENQLHHSKRPNKLLPPSSSLSGLWLSHHRQEGNPLGPLSNQS